MSNVFRTVFVCRPCAAAVQERGVLARVVVDSIEGVPYDVLGCPICGTHDLVVEHVGKSQERAPANGAAPPPPNAERAVATGDASPPANGTTAAAPKKADFVPLPSVVRCTSAGCEASLEFPREERVTDVLARNAWTSTAKTGTRCAAHREPITPDVAPTEAPPPMAALAE